MNYSKYKLSELFDKIDKLLQSYFGKEDDYNFMRKIILNIRQIYLKKVISCFYLMEIE